MDLRHLTDEQLLKDAKRIIEKENRLKTHFLHHLREIERRKLFCDLNCSSLFDYCTRVLKLSSGSAYRRIQASRLLAELPQIEEKIESGLLSLTNLTLASDFFTQHRIAEATEKLRVLHALEDLSKAECEKKLFEISGERLPDRDSRKRVSSDETKVSMILRDETVRRLDEVRSLLGKKMNYDELISYLLDVTIAQIEKRKFKSKSRLKLVKTSTRTVPAGIKGEVFRRDRVCQQCGSLYRLNFDHRVPYALGGETSFTNLRLLCFQCNQRARIKAKL